MTQQAKHTPYFISAFGQDFRGYIERTTMIEGELTHVVHFYHPETGTELVTTRPAIAKARGAA